MLQKKWTRKRKNNILNCTFCCGHGDMHVELDLEYYNNVDLCMCIYSNFKMQEWTKCEWEWECEREWFLSLRNLGHFIRQFVGTRTCLDVPPLFMDIANQ